MSKLGKVLLGTAAPLILAGGVLAFAGWKMGGETSLRIGWDGGDFIMSPFGISDENWFYGGEWLHGGEENEWQSSWIQLDEQELGEVRRLEVDLALGDLTVETNAVPSLDIDWSGADYQIHYEKKDDLLKIWSAASDVTRGSGQDATVTLYLPEGTELSDVSVNTALGDVVLSNLKIGNLKLDSKVGDVTLTSLALGTGDLRLDLGSFWAELDLTDSLSVDSKVGEVDVSGTLAGDLDLSAKLGTIYVSTGLPASAYHWDLNARVGSVWLEESLTEWESVKGGSGSYEMKAYSDIGDVDVSFDRG